MQWSNSARRHIWISRNLDIPVHRWLPKRHAKNTNWRGGLSYAADGWKQSTTAGWQRPEATSPRREWPTTTWWQRCTAFDREIKLGSVFKCEPLCSNLLQLDLGSRSAQRNRACIFIQPIHMVLIGRIVLELNSLLSQVAAQSQQHLKIVR